MRKPRPFPFYGIKIAGIERPLGRLEVWMCFGTDYLWLNLPQARRLRAWLDKAIAWMEEKEAK
jgi:hypothetical protein